MTEDFGVKHTFVVLAYGESKYLEACIESVLGQTVKSKIVIATSTPNALISSVASKYKIPVLVNETGGGIGQDWNFGLSVGATDYVTLAHQDDIYEKDFAATCLALATRYDEQNPLIIFTASKTERGGKVLNNDYKNFLRWLLIFPFHIKQCIHSSYWRKFVLLFSNSISCPGVFYVKKNLIGFSFDSSQKFVLDWKAWYEMSQMKGSFIYASRPLHIHREHEQSATSSINTEILKREEFQLLNEMWGNSWMAKFLTGLLSFTK